MSQTPFIAPPPPYFPEPPLLQKPKKNLAKIIIGVVVILMLGTGISLAARVWDPLWSPFRPSPEKVITGISRKMEKVKTLHSEAKVDFNLNAEPETSESGKFTMAIAMAIKSDLDGTDSQNLKSAGNFDATVSFLGMQISLAGENIIIGEDNYLKFTAIPFSLFADLGGTQGQWLKYDQENYLKSLYGKEVPQEIAGEKAKEKQEEMVKKFGAVLKNKKLYIVKEEFPDEKIRNKESYHYLVALNKEEIKKLLPELFGAMGDYVSLAFPIDQKGLEEISSKLDEFFEKIGEISGEIWIGKKDNYLYRIKAEKEIDISQLNKTAKGKIIIKADVDFSNFNQPLNIEAPKDFKLFEKRVPLMISPENIEGLPVLPK